MTYNKEYTNGEITIMWQPDKCCHSGNCAHNCPEVFRPQERPWIVMENASTDKIKHTIDKCPSGALSYKENK
ncbi:MAG: (4Fe-4S)-binding protein [Bacteroidales bacterium]|jgi:uncharacterized Fe-S cluster protein YjdI|nr:(4Fe-4S)-binding protein [Bacteroidales bacterium]